MPLGCCSVREHSVESGRRLGLASGRVSLRCGWLVRVMASQGQFVFGTYRRHMKTIGYLGQIDKLYGVPATTRNWNTIVAILQILKSQKNTR